jgi:hypothetical protein
MQCNPRWAVPDKATRRGACSRERLLRDSGQANGVFCWVSRALPWKPELLWDPALSNSIIRRLSYLEESNALLVLSSVLCCPSTPDGAANSKRGWGPHGPYKYLVHFDKGLERPKILT